LKGDLLKKYDTFVFDWDGTLSSLKSMRKINEMVNPYWNYKKSVQSRVTEEELRDFSRLTARARRGMRRRSSEKRIFAPFLDLVMSLMKPKLHNDAREILDELKREGKRIALLTNGASWRVTKELEFLGIEGYFEVIVSAQELKILKPNPMGLNIVLSIIKARRSRTLYIGDMGDDVLLARYARVPSCAVSCGFDNYQKLKSLRPDYLFRSLEGLRNAL